MANLNDILADAQGGQAIAMLGSEFGLTPEQADAAVAALLPAISTGLKRATATPDGPESERQPPILLPCADWSPSACKRAF